MWVREEMLVIVLEARDEIPEAGIKRSRDSNRQREISGPIEVDKYDRKRKTR